MSFSGKTVLITGASEGIGRACAIKFAQKGADLILIETMSDTYELKAAVLAAKENSDLPVMATVAFDEKGKILTGASPEGVVALLEGLGVDALGMNCGLGPKEMAPIFDRMVKCTSIPLIINPNAGLPRNENGETVFDVTGNNTDDKPNQELTYI